MDLNDSTQFTPTIKASDDNPFEFEQERCLTEPVTTGMSGHDVSPVTKTMWRLVIHFNAVVFVQST